MDAKLINPFIHATKQVIQTMAFVESLPGKPFLKNDNIAKGDVTGIIKLKGEINGSISISFEASSIFRIVSNMFGEEINVLNNEITDAVGEITNMISGQARRELEETGTVIEAEIPSVISGENHAIKHCVSGVIIGITFTINEGSFTIELCMAK